MSSIETQTELATELVPVLLALLKNMRRQALGLGRPPIQTMLLGCIKRQPGIGVSELAQQEGIKPPTISLHVKELEAAGLVMRAQAEGDRRRAPLMVTPAGQQVLAETFGLWVNWIAGRLEHLTPEARAALRQALDPLRELNS